MSCLYTYIAAVASKNAYVNHATFWHKAWFFRRWFVEVYSTTSQFFSALFELGPSIVHIVRHQPVASSALLRRNVHAHPRIGQKHTGRCARASQLERARSPHTQFCSVADCYSVSERHLHTQGCFSVKASKLALTREVFPYDLFHLWFLHILKKIQD